MLPFFRKIRYRLAKDNQFFKYSRYAVGEIVLVVIGILIALQINNWNQNRIDQNKIKEYAISLIKDLEADIIMTRQIQMQNEEIISRIDSLSAYLSNKEIKEISNVKMLYYTLNKPHRPYVWNRTTITELKNSGALGLIKDDTLSVKISEYDSFTHHLDEDFVNDRTQFEKATDFSSSIVNHNYLNLHEFNETLLPNNNYRINNFFESEVYLNAKHVNLELLSTDINEVLKMANNYKILMLYLRIRTDQELPQLVRDAEEIISLLKLNYLE